MASLCNLWLTRVNTKRPDRLRENVNPHPGFPYRSFVRAALKARLLWRLHRLGAAFCPCFLAEFILCNTTKFFFGGTVPMSMNPNRILQTIAGAAISIAMMAGAQTPASPAATPAPADQAPAPATAPAAAPAAPAALSTFVLTGPLQWLPPATFDAGPLGKLSVNGIVTGFAQFQNNSVPGDDRSEERRVGKECRSRWSPYH